MPLDCPVENAMDASENADSWCMAISAITAYMPWPASSRFAMLHTVKATTSSSTAGKTKRATSFEPEVATAIGGVIRRFRESTGIAQDVIPVLAQVDRSYYGKLERGERQPSIGVLLRIASALGTTAADLVGQAELILSKKRRPRRVAVAQTALDEAKKLVTEQRRVVASRKVAAKRSRPQAKEVAVPIKPAAKKKAAG